jgi:4-diphosphocytidyl-2C-methyl-D-erythritol 2-phosphate synthase
MICFPNAKINLGLNIVSRRTDGYHNLETVFYPIGLRDALEIVPSDPDVPFAPAGPDPQTDPTELNSRARTSRSGSQPAPSRPFRFFQTGDIIQGNEEDNLVVKALKLISSGKEFPGIDIHLLKKIPSGAGLGGGSSDAAFMLRLLNDTFKWGYSDDGLMRFAAQLGADCPFFIRNKPAFATGIGDELEPIELDVSGFFSCS